MEKLELYGTSNNNEVYAIYITFPPIEGKGKMYVVKTVLMYFYLIRNLLKPI